jgi:flagellar assembly protein FliH
MSSKVIAASDGRTVAPISWDKLKPQPAAPKKPPSAAEQTAELETRSAQVEARLAQLQKAYDADVAAAYRRGYGEGEAHAKAGPAAEMQSAVLRLAQSVQEMVQLRPRLRREAESDVVRLALAIARRVLRREMSLDPTAMQALVQVALQKLDRQEISRVYVHPNQAAAIRSALEAAGLHAEVIPQITRESGALVFETNQGLLDASINAQLEEIESGLADRLNRND